MLKAHHELTARGSFLASNQVKYNLLDRRIESNGILETAKEHNISIIAYSPLAQGILTGKFHDNPALLNNKIGIRRYLPQFKKNYLDKTRPLIDLLKSIADNHQVSPAQVALNWLIKFHGETVVAIPGASKTEQAKSNAGAMNFTLGQREMDEIDQASKQLQ
jgi:aryl-alcohol dehydrogenase-like predicted oxidoreductase